jgi:predicted RNA-binding protein with PIN domain
MLFLVDGYNVTMADDATRRLERGAQRMALVRRLAARGRGLLGAGEYVVVFDGGRLAEDEDHGPVQVVFSGDRSADDVIVDAAARADGRLSVVTSDRELRSRVREHAGRSVQVLPASALFEQAPATHGRRLRTDARHPHGGLPTGHEDVTRELTDIWLSKEEK